MRGWLLAVLFACVWFACGESARAADERPNVIIVLSDDQGYGDFSCHGNPILKTPNLDRLRDESIRFVDFHVAPMCTPTRGQLLTGLDAMRSGATSVCAGRSFIRRGTPTMPELFAAGGYRTGIFGKWHLGDSYPNHPYQRGFQESVSFPGWGLSGAVADIWCNDYFNGRYSHNGEIREYPGYCTDVWFDEAMKWMGERDERGEPFLAYIPTNCPHGPHWVAEQYRAPYENLKRKVPAAFFGMIANLDESMARLDKFLVRSGLRDKTIVVYMHDNGGTAGVNVFNAGMRGRKTQYYEGGHRAACFVRWPAGKFRPAGDVDGLAQVQDLLPTFLDVCQIPTPQGTQFDGASLSTVLRGEAPPDRTLVVQYGQDPKKWQSAVLWQKWRLVHGEELYDLRTDPAQEKNVAAENPDVLHRMREHYESWWAGVEPRLYDFSPISIGAAEENPVRLTSADWANVYCDNVFNVREGLNANGVWHLLVEQDGEYEFTLRRWPKEADAAISAGVPLFQAREGTLPEGRALPVVKARFKLGEQDESRPVSSSDQGIMFAAQLKRGPSELQTWFYDAAGEQLCGAYYVDVRRK